MCPLSHQCQKAALELISSKAGEAQRGLLEVGPQKGISPPKAFGSCEVPGGGCCVSSRITFLVPVSWFRWVSSVVPTRDREQCCVAHCFYVLYVLT